MNLNEACKIVGNRYFPGIRNPAGFLESIPNWKPIYQAFPPKNHPGDIDGILERHGQFLIIEKKQVGATVVPWSGQTRTLKALHNLGVFTIIYIWGDEANPQAICVIRPTDEFQINPQPVTYNEWISILKEWWAFAEQHEVY